MKDKRLNIILKELMEAQRLAKKEFDINNILQPGIIKEIIMARILHHKPMPNKRDPDATDSKGNYYEYLSSVIRTTKNNKGSSFQIDRIMTNNLNRITRNRCFYFGFFKDNLKILEIWSVETQIILEEVKRQLKYCKNKIAHVNFLTSWVHKVGKRVYP